MYQIINLNNNNIVIANFNTTSNQFEIVPLYVGTFLTSVIAEVNSHIEKLLSKGATEEQIIEIIRAGLYSTYNFMIIS